MKPHKASILVNGQRRTVDLPLTVVDLLDEMGFKSTQVVVERNGEVVPRSKLPDASLANGDRLEFIVPVAGG
jgi:sulfur carrier protein